MTEELIARPEGSKFATGRVIGDRGTVDGRMAGRINSGVHYARSLIEISLSIREHVLSFAS